MPPTHPATEELHALSSDLGTRDINTHPLHQLMPTIHVVVHQAGFPFNSALTVLPVLRLLFVRRGRPGKARPSTSSAYDSCNALSSIAPPLASAPACASAAQSISPPVS
eukprot:CAMPEP_0196783988 /NCGR_PEP_ID=MMETSP1104-20130614/15639_1 /TAXON_ID=33652 /ORGANISM="Cafeteria sp., Strain Caron Lab Isolate" /LENGTH=108 /DNA_ID=CAMNT_0042154257 /DNA_START=16 /DNA_END=340 /DNA_ORIENTATION=-